MTDNTSEAERKFQEDLAKAQALSLESLALETYQRQRKFRSDSTTSAASVPHLNRREVANISLPRPGSFRGIRDPLPRLPPPPSSQRRNSAAAAAAITPVTVDTNTTDLISFSPSPTEKTKPQQEFDAEETAFGSPKVKLDFSQTSVNAQFTKALQQSNLAQPTQPNYHVNALPLYLGSTPGSNRFFPGFNAVHPNQLQFVLPDLSSIQNARTLEQGPRAIMVNDFRQVLKVCEKKDNSNLIDLSLFDKSPDDSCDATMNQGVSVLEAFDPLTTTVHITNIKSPVIGEANKTENAEYDGEEDGSESSFYNPYDPFDLYAPGEREGDIYATVNKKRKEDTSPPPLPPRPSGWEAIEKRRGTIEGHVRKNRLHENIKVQKRRAALHDSDLQAFHAMVKTLRAKFPSSDVDTNVGLVYSPTLTSQYKEDTSIKLIVHSTSSASPVTFACDVSTSVEHVIQHVVCALHGDLASDAGEHHLKVCGLAEYFAANTCLADYEHIHTCMKLEVDVVLAIVHGDQLVRPLARTALDDARDTEMTLEDLLPNEPVQPISYDSLLILLETVECEMERLITRVSERGLRTPAQPSSVIQAVKAICALMGSVETLEISDAVEALRAACNVDNPTRDSREVRCRPEIVSEDGDFSMVTLRPRSVSDAVPSAVAMPCERIRHALQSLIETYCHAFRVDFQLNPRADFNTTCRLSSDILDSVFVHVGCLHRPLQGWQHDEFFLTAQIFHGTQPVSQPIHSCSAKKSAKMFTRVEFNFVMHFYATSVSVLPLESRVVLVLHGRTVLPPDTGDKDQEPQVQEVELVWAAMQLFNFEGMMNQGSFLLSCWPTVADKRLGPAPAAGTYPQGHSDPVLWVELPDYGGRTLFPPKRKLENVPMLEFSSLDYNTQQQLLTITEQDTFTRLSQSDGEVLWEKRHYLHERPQALPKVLLAARSWDWACLGDLHSMLDHWTPMEPVSALQLLLPCFPDMEVRRKAVQWINVLGSDELVDYLPQLVQALKHQTFETSSLAEFLLERALTSPRVAHHLYWLLMQTLPGQSPQNSSETTADDDRSLSEARHHRRLQLMLRALFAVSGEALRGKFLSQQILVKSMYDIAESVKSTKESLRLKTLVQQLGSLHQSLEAGPTCLPLSPSLEVAGVQVRTCSYFPSNTLPLKINFLSAETGIIPAIFKVGDDLQQDMLTLQMVRIMDKLWLREGLDLKMVTFACVPTGVKRGMIEMVSSAETLRKIQVELGLTGSFKDRPIAEWLAKHNPSPFENERAVANFTASCAGYSVATYILGICDRHNDNIMLKTSGHLFHIDFGKFLGDAQMFGSFKRDRTPFVLTSDMAYVINGGDRPTEKFHHFVDLCCRAFNIVRKNGSLLLSLFGLMVSAGIPGVTMDAVCYVQKALLPDKSNAEASAMFTRMIEHSLKSWFTQFNFFLHNIAQLRFTGDHNDGELLSFVPRTYTMQQEGRIRSVGVFSYQKRYDPEKYYVYIVRVERDNSPDPAYLFRSYKEFCELHQKLCLLFPLAKCHSLPTGLSMGRSNIKQVAERRQYDIEMFLQSLFRMADEVAHSDIVYTFFHPLLRDQQDANIYARKVKEVKAALPSSSESRRLCGQLKLSLNFSRNVLTIMVHHARGLPLVATGNEPSPYVKIYLLPDPDKRTKRKTKVVRRNCHPTFMEMLEYRHWSLEMVQSRTLQATVWNHDALQENEFLGGVTLPLNAVDLSDDTVEWYSLGNIRRL